MGERYTKTPMDLSELKTVSVFTRGGKVSTADFAVPHTKGAKLGEWLEKLPKLLAANTLRQVVERIQQAKALGKPVIWGMGGHVVKCGLAPVLIDLMRRGFISSFAMNGSTSIHDFEIAICGATSEDVEAVLPDGSFGSAEETGRWMNEAIVEGAATGMGMGESLGQKLEAVGRPEWRTQSILHAAWEAGVPVTVHVAVGTDTPHTHPLADGAAIGATSHQDFRLLCSLVSELDGGGVYVNCGSAVVLPEVFLKALSSVRNLGHRVQNFTTVNLDFMQHYRPRMNVVERPHAGSIGGGGLALTGHHEILVPLLAALLVEGSGE